MYEIRKGGRVWVSSPMPNCGYTPEELQSLRKHGFKVHVVEDKEKKGRAGNDR